MNAPPFDLITIHFEPERPCEDEADAEEAAAECAEMKARIEEMVRACGKPGWRLTVKDLGP